MSEQTSGKKVVGRNIAIALGIIVMILVVGLVGAVSNYTGVISGKDNTIASKDSTINDLNSQVTSKNSQIEDKDNTISSLNSQIAEKDSQISSLNSQISSKDSAILTLTSQKNELQDIVNLEKSTIWVNKTVSHPAGLYTYWTATADYAGYVKVSLQTSNTTDNYIQVIYSSHGVNYDNQIDVVAGGGAVFPILPSTSIEIRLCNTSQVASSATLTIIYYY